MGISTKTKSIVIIAGGVCLSLAVACVSLATTNFDDKPQWETQRDSNIAALHDVQEQIDANALMWPKEVHIDGKPFVVDKGYINVGSSEKLAEGTVLWQRDSAAPNSKDQGTVVFLSTIAPKDKIVVTSDLRDTTYHVSNTTSLIPGSFPWKYIGEKTFNRASGEEQAIFLTPEDNDKGSYTITIADKET